MKILHGWFRKKMFSSTNFFFPNAKGMWKVQTHLGSIKLSSTKQVKICYPVICYCNPKCPNITYQTRSKWAHFWRDIQLLFVALWGTNLFRYIQPRVVDIECFCFNLNKQKIEHNLSLVDSSTFNVVYRIGRKYYL